jgi:hypothetical protein
MVIVGIPRDRVIEYDMGGEDTEQRRSKIADHITFPMIDCFDGF